jgi:GTP-dependent phosphoenolpyruvate carboxykinase
MRNRGKVQLPDYIKHRALGEWIEKMVALCKPERVYFCDGSQEEYDRLCGELVAAGTFIKLNEQKRPNSYLAGQTRAMWRASRTALSFVAARSMMPAPRTTGFSRNR